MKIDRLLKETIYLLNHGRTSAQFFSQYFEVSIRTIVRDIDTLCMAGIPVVSVCGADGGYEIMSTFKIQQQVAGEMDYNYVICALEGLVSAYTNKDIETTLEKMKSLTTDIDNTMIMDLSVVHENRNINEILLILNRSIQIKHVISFLYTNNKDEQKQVKVEPVAVIYKWYSWYLIGYCLKHQDYRMYKLVRIEKPKILEKQNTKVHDLKRVKEILKNTADDRKRIKIVLYCSGKLKSKCCEYLKGRVCKEYSSGDFEYEFVVPEDEQLWYGVILSFGKDAKVISPIELAKRIKENCMDIIEMYK